MDEIFRMPEGVQNRCGFRVPVRIGRFAKLVSGSGLYDSGILEVWRIVFSANLFNQRRRRLDRILKEKDFIRPVVKSVDAVLLGLFQVTGCFFQLRQPCLDTKKSCVDPLLMGVRSDDPDHLFQVAVLGCWFLIG
jgi:hypothetical protein